MGKPCPPRDALASSQPRPPNFAVCEPTERPTLELSEQRDALVCAIRRGSLAGVLAMAGVVALTLGVVWQARQAQRQTQRADAEAAGAEAARREADAQLWNARLSEAHALRITGGAGARERSAAIVTDLTRTPGLTEAQRLALRTEVIAQAALLDLAAPQHFLNGEYDGSASAGRGVQRWREAPVELRSLSDGRPLVHLPGPARNGFTRFSPQGTYAATTFETQPVALRVWRAADATVVCSNTVPAGSLHGGGLIEFSPDERWLAAGTEAGLEIWSLPEGRLLRQAGRAQACAFSPGGRWLARAVDDWLEIEATQTGSVWLRHRLPLSAHLLTWRPQGNVLGAAADGAVALVELPAEGETEPVEIRMTTGHGSLVTYAEFTPDGSALVTTSWDGFTLFWDALTRRKLLSETRQLVTDLGGVNPSALVIRPYPSRTAITRLWQREGFRIVAGTTPRQDPPVGVTPCPKGRWLAVESVRGTSVFDPVTGREVARMPGVSPEFSASGDSLWTCEGDRVMRFRVAKAGAQVWDRAGDIFVRTPPGTRANSVSLSTDGRVLVVCAADEAVLLLDASTGVELRRVAVPAHYARLATDGETVVTQFHNGPAHLARSGDSNSVTYLGQHLNARFDPTGRWLGVATEQILAFFERQPTNHYARRYQVPLEGGAGAPATFTFAPGGELAAVVFNRFDVRLYEPASGRVLAVLSAPYPAQITGVRGLAFSADGHELFAAKQDGEVVAWHLPTLRALLIRLGLDWASPVERDVVTATAVRSTATGGGLWASMAVGAGTAALLAGVVVFALQRRMLTAYERAAALAEVRQKRLNETQLALAQSQKLEALGTLAAGVAHDFNNLLSVIRMSNHFVAKVAPPDPTVRENLEAIEQAVVRGRDLVRSMLGYVRRTDDEAGVFTVARVVGDTMGMLSRQFLSGLTLSLELDPRCPPVRGSAARLEQVLLNLVINAAEAMQGRGNLTVTSREVVDAPTGVLAPATAGPAVELIVRDSGPGITREHLPRVFDPFFTTKQSSARPGTGLGLSVVYTLAKQSGWGLAVESQPGAGTVFHVYLPIQESDGHDTERPGLERATGRGKPTCG